MTPDLICPWQSSNLFYYSNVINLHTIKTYIEINIEVKGIRIVEKSSFIIHFNEIVDYGREVGATFERL